VRKCRTCNSRESVEARSVVGLLIEIRKKDENALCAFATLYSMEVTLMKFSGIYRLEGSMITIDFDCHDEARSEVVKEAQRVGKILDGKAELIEQSIIQIPDSK